MTKKWRKKNQHQQNQQTGQSFSKIAFHQGKALRHLSNLYPTLQETILEMVQNSMDRDVQATRVSININYKTRRLVITDNGNGISVDKMNKVLTTVADSARSAEHKQGGLGQFAIGLMSPLGKCEYYLFTSCPKPHLYGFNEWVFRCREIENQREEISVPMRPCSHLTTSETVTHGQERVNWRTKVELVNFSRDAVISRIEIDDLAVAIQDRYSVVMRKNKVVVSIKIVREDGKEEARPNVQAPQFKGQPLPEYNIMNPEAGKVTIKLYAAPRVKYSRAGRIVVGNFSGDFKLPFQYFLMSAKQLLSEEVTTALSCGIFEGEISAGKIKINASRSGFEKDDAYIGLCVAIEDWFNTHGKKFLEEIKLSTKEQRYQELGLRSLKVLGTLLQDIKFAPLLNVIKSFACGLVGTGHKKPNAKDIVEQQDKTSLSVDGKPGIPRQHDPEAESRERTPAEEEKKEKIHKTATGPKGRPRKVVKNASVGLQLTYDQKEGSRTLWELDIEEGILSLNTRHYLWEACEKKDIALMKLQEYVAIQALTLYAMPESFRAQQRQVLDELCYSFVYWLLNSDKARRN